MYSWHNGELVEGDVKISSFNFSLHYSSPAVWEGIRAYLQDDGTTKIWKLKDHVYRLEESAKIIGMELPYYKAEIEKAIIELVEANGGGDQYIRPIAYAAGNAEGIHSVIDKINLDIYSNPFKKLHKTTSEGLRMVISNIIRSYPQFQMQAKTPTNYQAVQLAKNITKMQNVDDVFVLDNNGYITEATVSNVWVVRENYIMTPPNKGSILPGITRKCVAEILANSSLMLSKYKVAPMVVEKDITKADLYTADEVFLSGTYSEIKPVLEIDGREIGNGSVGFYTKLLMEEYTNLVRGRT